jgi:hypothetical protein
MWRRLVIVRPETSFVIRPIRRHIPEDGIILLRLAFFVIQCIIQSITGGGTLRKNCRRLLSTEVLCSNPTLCMNVCAFSFCVRVAPCVIVALRPDNPRESNPIDCL